MDSSEWNDDAIVSLFQDAIRTHQTRNNGKNKKRKQNAVQWSTDIRQYELPPTHDGIDRINDFTDQTETIIETSKPITWEEGECIEDLGSRENVSASKSDITTPVPKIQLNETHFSNYVDSRTHNILASNDMMEESLSSMLMSWYQSGYATGRYQTLLELQNHGIDISSYLTSSDGNVDENVRAKE